MNNRQVIQGRKKNEQQAGNFKDQVSRESVPNFTNNQRNAIFMSQTMT